MENSNLNRRRRRLDEGNIQSSSNTRQEEQRQRRQEREQQQPPNDISELTDGQHDQLVLYKLHDEEIKKKVATQLCNQITAIVHSMGSFISQNKKAKIKEIEHNKGSYVAWKRFLSLGTTRKLSSGWSRQLLQIISNMNLNVTEELIKPNQNDLDDSNERMGIPRNSILDQIAVKLERHCSILVSPMKRPDEDSERVPVVHPELCVSEDHFRRNTAFTDGSYRPAEETRQAYKESPRITFNAITKSNVQTTEAANKYEVLLRKHHGISLFLIGPAGSGKTTLTKRMVKAWIKEKKMAFFIPFAQIDQSQRLRLKNLLTKFLFRLHNLEHDPSKEEIDEAFHWILANQDKCMLVFDGLDQAGFEISKEFIPADINDELMPCDLLALILTRKFLPGIRLVLSTRPHSIASLVPATQPQIVVFLNELLSNDVEKLMDYYLDRGSASEIMAKLRVKSPRIHRLLFNPLFLRLIVMLKKLVGEAVWTYVNTTAKLFHEVINRLQMSAHHECGLGVEDVEVLNDKLADMAFHKTMERSVVFKREDLERHGLNGDNVQDFLFGVMQQNTALLVGLVENERAMIFFFNHQSTQEYFSAKFALEKLAIREFKELVERFFPPITLEQHDRLHLGEDFFGNLRVLVGGCINEMELRAIEGGEVLTKKNFFITSLSDHLRKIFSQIYNEHGVDSEQHQKQILVGLLDIREDGVTREIRQILSDFNFVISFVSLDIAHRESLFHFIQNFITRVQLLSLNITRWSEDEIQRLFQAIQSSIARIENMDIEMDERLPYVNEMIEIFPHLTRNLELRLNGYGRQFCRSMEEEINNFDTSHLQTQELEVKIIGLDGRTLLHVVIRRGESPQFITSEY